MMNIKIELIDNDHVVRAKTDLGLNGNADSFGRFVRRIKEELVPGETAFLEVDGSDMDTITLEISHLE